MNKFFFIRNDDVSTFSEPLRKFVNFMLIHKIPIIYGVIPARLEKETAVLLREAKEKNPGLLDIVQHGYAHDNYAPFGEKKYEFGEGRSYDRQLHDITEGMKIMHRWFGDLVTPGFIPPYHADDPNTIDAIEALGIPLYSARLKVPRERKKFLDVPAQIWAHRIDDQGQPVPLNFHNLARDLGSVLASGPISGIVFYHRYITANPKDRDVFTASMSLILQEQALGKLRVVLFSDLLAVGAGRVT